MMPAISKIRFTNVIYDSGGKRYNDDIFQFDGYNGTILLENGGGKTVFIQTALQVVLPHYTLGERKIRNTLSLEGNPCHVAIEWILNERPRKYLLTAVTLFLVNNRLESYRYVYEYSFDDDHGIENIPFVKGGQEGNKRPASRGEINDYYQYMQSQNMNAKTFKTIREYQQYIEENYKIIPSEWKSIARINSVAGGVEKYFDECKTTTQLVNNLLIPVVEDAISENGTEDFVKTFEEQRERFKRHRQLREKIEESKQIEEKINGYVNVFEDYYNVSEKYLDKKQYSKAIYMHTEKEKSDIEEKINKNEEDRDRIENLYKELERKEKSYEVAVLEEKLNEYKIELDESKKSFSRIESDFKDKNIRLNNLEISKLKQEIKTEEENIENYKKNIEILQSDKDVEYIQSEIDRNSSMLRGCFITEENELRKGKKELLDEEKEIKEKYDEEKDKLEELKNTKANIIEDINRKKGQNIEIEKSLKNIRAKLLTLSEHDDIKTEQQKWQMRVNELESSNTEGSNRIRQLQIEKNTIDEELTECRDNLDNLNEQRILIKNKIDAIDDSHGDLLTQVQELNESWHYIDSLYTRQQTVINYLENKVENLISEKEELLLEERICGRFKDDYEHNNYFTPEPMLEEWITSWKGQFKYIETGTEYIQRAAETLNIRETEFLDSYPYWAFAVVVDDGEVETLKEKLSKYIDKMTSPILILKEDEVVRIIKEGKDVDEFLVLPEHWTKNINQQFFENWKLEINQKVREITEVRKFKEHEVAKHKEILKKLRDFFAECPYEYYKKLKDEQGSAEENCSNIKNLIKNREDRLNAIEEETNILNKRINDNGVEVDSLNQWIQLAQDYMIKEKDKENIIYDINQLNDKCKKLNAQIDIAEKDVTGKAGILKKLSDDIAGLANKIENLTDAYLYKEVKDADPIFADMSITGLEEERINFKNMLSVKQDNISKYYGLIGEKEKYIDNKSKNLKRERKRSDYPIDETMTFPFYGEKEIEDLMDYINKLKPVKAEAERKLKQAESKHQKQSTRYDISREQFFEKYKEIVEFSDSLDNIKMAIHKEKEELLKRENKNKEIQEKFLKEKEDIDKCIESLKISDGKYEYLAKTIEPVHLTEEFYRDFPYKRKTFIDDALENLEGLKEELERASTKLDNEKNNFVAFCNNEINDPRLRERTISGINYKTNYNEILEWQSKMQIRIKNTIRIAEDDIRQHDKDLEQFIGHLCTYLRILTDELGIIPKKTRIKIDDNWRDIYRFNIPEWKEEEGKVGLRRYIDWMIEQLESSEFKNEDGTDNSAGIRKEIEGWLDSKKLLGVVLKNNQIKISCRKVTNDGKISGGLTTWESSNRWSGGEKWSKNMTLFLGILNYVAEKRQGVITGLKSNRTVIVDNPFGEASSDHVLDPVFMIAEKLGFQIIALTALSEGVFVRSYFPVVYSCKLRQSVDNNSLIIDKEKEIQHAFFKDNDPGTLNRLEEKRQLSLFG